MVFEQDGEDTEDGVYYSQYLPHHSHLVSCPGSKSVSHTSSAKAAQKSVIFHNHSQINLYFNVLHCLNLCKRFDASIFLGMVKQISRGATVAAGLRCGHGVA